MRSVIKQFLDGAGQLTVTGGKDQEIGPEMSAFEGLFMIEKAANAPPITPMPRRSRPRAPPEAIVT
ncbi:hypothetical protein [Kitasatospora sp. NPDC059571]|uniref:hypothetical protein n=1 Tax=Kitasatospora sp. NPDC059571 TaxID=3346871 RepID=UPI0036806C2D